MKVNWATSPGNAPKQDTSSKCKQTKFDFLFRFCYLVGFTTPVFKDFVTSLVCVSFEGILLKKGNWRKVTYPTVSLVVLEGERKKCVDDDSFRALVPRGMPF